MMIFKNFFIYFSFYAADAKMSPQGQLIVYALLIFVSRLATDMMSHF